ncbi:MAG TPA: hypothetical protein VG077_19545 [Verrucomicrobiae bacterium]|nr:hypothetical protein [Verrucomicrobiae bacterium]
MKNKKTHHAAIDGFSVGGFLTSIGTTIEMLTDDQRLNLARFIFAIAVSKDDPNKAFCDNFPEAQSLPNFLDLAPIHMTEPEFILFVSRLARRLSPERRRALSVFLAGWAQDPSGELPNDLKAGPGEALAVFWGCSHGRN